MINTTVLFPVLLLWASQEEIICAERTLDILVIIYVKGEGYTGTSTYLHGQTEILLFLSEPPIKHDHI